METEYTKREMDEHFKDVKERFDRQDLKLAEIQATGKATDAKVAIQNGRVGKLESKWTGVVMGGGVGVFLIGIIMSLIVYSFIVSQENLKSSILLEVKQMQK